MLPPGLRDHFERPRHAGDLPGATHTGRAGNPACGDLLVLRLLVRSERIERAAFRAQGCSAVIAVASLVAETLPGRTVAEAAAFDVPGLVRAAGGVPPGQDHAAGVLERAIVDALGSGA